MRARRRLCSEQAILVNGKIASGSYKLKAGQIVSLAEQSATDINQSQDEQPYLISQNQDFAAIYKPRFWHSAHIQGKTGYSVEKLLPTLLSQSSTCAAAHLVNRLDFYTSGLLLVACSSNAFNLLQQATKNYKISKKYLALVSGHLEHGFNTYLALDTDNRQKSKLLSHKCEQSTKVKPLACYNKEDLSKISEFIQLESVDKASLVMCEIQMGARHQIRVHLAAHNHPLLGDELYGGLKANFFLLHHFLLELPEFSASHLPDWLKFLPNEHMVRSLL